jgi:hypothetical protein
MEFTLDSNMKLYNFAELLEELPQEKILVSVSPCEMIIAPEILPKQYSVSRSRIY